MPGSGARPRPRCPGVLDMRESHAVRVRCSRAICATCKKVCHKSYTSGQFLVYGFYVLDVICLNGKTIWRNARYMKGEHSSTTLGKSSYQSKIILIMHQALRRRQDGEFASSRRLRAWPGGGGGGARSWTEISLSTPGPCPEAAEGRVAGRGVCFLRQSGGWGLITTQRCPQFGRSEKNSNSTQFVELFWGVLEQIKPLQPIVQAAEFKFESKFEPIRPEPDQQVVWPVVWQSLTNTIREDNRRIWLQNQWPSSWGRALAQLGRVWRRESTPPSADFGPGLEVTACGGRVI